MKNNNRRNPIISVIGDSDNKGLPKDWKIHKVGEVCKAVTGTTPPKNENSNYGNRIPFVKPPQLLNKPIGDAPEKLSDKGATLARVLPVNSVMVTCIGNLGRTAINKIPVAFNQQINALIPSDVLDGKFLFYQTQSGNFRKQLEKLSSATTVAIVNKGKFETIQIVVPPLPEQHRIVAKLEELLSELEKGKEQLHTALDQLKVYRQAVLKYAFEGKLTRQNRGLNGFKDDTEKSESQIKRIKGLTQKNKNNNPRNPVIGEISDSDNGELPNGWKWVKLIDVAKKITDGEHFRPKTEGKGIPFLSAKDVRDNGVSFEQPLYISKETAAKALQRCNPVRGDILIVSRGATVGRMCIVKTDKIFCLLGSVILIKVNENLVSEYLTYILKSPSINQKLIGISGATAQQAIYLRDIKNVEIPLPTIEEQHRIVEEIESRLSVADKLEETITASLQQSETLRQSILKKAFEGKLV